MSIFYFIQQTEGQFLWNLMYKFNDKYCKIRKVLKKKFLHENFKLKPGLQSQLSENVDLMQIWWLLISINCSSFQVWVDWLPYICLLFSGFSNVYHFVCVWPTALKQLAALLMWHALSRDGAHFFGWWNSIHAIISSHHICIRSIACMCANVAER